MVGAWVSLYVTAGIVWGIWGSVTCCSRGLLFVGKTRCADGEGSLSNSERANQGSRALK